jgi:hypothetical protein
MFKKRPVLSCAAVYAQTHKDLLFSSEYQVCQRSMHTRPCAISALLPKAMRVWNFDNRFNTAGRYSASSSPRTIVKDPLPWRVRILLRTAPTSAEAFDCRATDTPEAIVVALDTATDQCSEMQPSPLMTTSPSDLNSPFVSSPLIIYAPLRDLCLAAMALDSNACHVTLPEGRRGRCAVSCGEAYQEYSRRRLEGKADHKMSQLAAVAFVGVTSYVMAPIAGLDV